MIRLRDWLFREFDLAAFLIAFAVFGPLVSALITAIVHRW